jgi:hypothetical protein
MHPDTNETENALFRACTEATLNGHKLRFWTDGWLGGCIIELPSRHRRLQEWWTSVIATGTVEQQTTEQGIIYAA